VVYVGFNLGDEAVRAWGVVISTDTAFLIGVLALVGQASRFRKSTPMDVDPRIGDPQLADERVDLRVGGLDMSQRRTVDPILGGHNDQKARGALRPTNPKHHHVVRDGLQTLVGHRANEPWFGSSCPPECPGLLDGESYRPMRISGGVYRPQHVERTNDRMCMPCALGCEDCHPEGVGYPSSGSGPRDSLRIGHADAQSCQVPTGGGVGG